MHITSASRAQISLAWRAIIYMQKILFFYLQVCKYLVRKKITKYETPTRTTPGIEPNVQCTNDAVDQSSQNSMAVGLNNTFVQFTKASETQTATLANIKEDILLCPQSDEEKEKEDSNTRNTQNTLHYVTFVEAT